MSDLDRTVETAAWFHDSGGGVYLEVTWRFSDAVGRYPIRQDDWDWVKGRLPVEFRDDNRVGIAFGEMMPLPRWTSGYSDSEMRDLAHELRRVVLNWATANV